MTKKPKKNKPRANASQIPPSARPKKQTSHPKQESNSQTPTLRSASEQSAVVAETTFPPLDLSTPQLTVRAIATGMFIGALLSLCNIYSGLKIGWGFNMSVTAALLSYGFWQAFSSLTGSREWNIYENNVNQTAASSAAMISSAGLVAPIPALTIMTGQSFSWTILSVWVFSVACVGVVVAIGLRRQMLVVDKLPFPSGIATAETLKQMYARGDEAMQRVKMLLGGALAASLAKIAVAIWKIKNLPMFGSFPVGAKMQAAGISSLSFSQVSFAFDPSTMMVAVGMLIGLRACVSILLGAVVAWTVVGPYAVEAGFVAYPMRALDPWGLVTVVDPSASFYGPMLKWLLWPGVSMMVVAALTSFAFSWRSVLAVFQGGRRSDQEVQDRGASHDVPRAWFLSGLVVTLAMSVICQSWLFGIGTGIATFGVLLSFLLAVVAGRVSGETGITPVGPMGKVTQLTFGVLDPGNVSANLMAAGVTGGAASQCADLLHDLKTGALIGASPRYQAIAQFFGVLSGALAGSAAYLLLIPDPKGMLMTEEWAAPAVAQWMAVAEVFKKGLSNMPPGSLVAIFYAGVAGMILAVLEKVLPKHLKTWVPSPASIGLAFVIPAFYSMSFFFGGIIALAISRLAPKWSERFLIVLAAGVIAGESITGMILAFIKL
ncbi:OPT/YSL family transporter [Myxococcota bacterium]|nr:OPT/YSL family transporter [Myxococcota bacterium]